MQLENYTLKQQNTQHRVEKNGKLLAHGLVTAGDGLQAIYQDRLKYGVDERLSYIDGKIEIDM